MKLIEMLHNQTTAEKPVSAPNMYAYTHQDEVFSNAVHEGLAPLYFSGINLEQLFMMAMAVVVAAIRDAGEMPDDLNDIPLVGAAQAEHDVNAERLLSSIPQELCPDCGQGQHPGACEETA